jgi:hypothetical protein
MSALSVNHPNQRRLSYVNTGLGKLAAGLSISGGAIAAHSRGRHEHVTKGLNAAIQAAYTST